MTDNIQPDSPKKSVATTTSKSSSTTTVEKNKSVSAKKIVSPFALIISVAALLSVGATTYWQMHQNQQLSASLIQVTSSAIKANAKQLKQALRQELKQQFTQQLKIQTQKTTQEISLITSVIKKSQAGKITQLETEINRLSQNKPSDWLIHEAEYLVRVAARTMWLERDTKAAIGLLHDADNRLDELNDPRFLPIRKVIHQDIKQLKLMPKLTVEPTMLALMALNDQLKNLPLNPVEVITLTAPQSDFQLSEDISDWQSNLNKTWLNFLDTFVVIHRRDGNAKPLLSPQQQMHLVENLSLKLEQAQWAVRAENSAMYKQTLTDIDTWFLNYFDMNADINQKFLTDIADLKEVAISYNYPSTLASLTAMRKLISDLPSQRKKESATQKSTPSINAADKAVKQTVNKPNAEVKTEGKVKKIAPVEKTSTKKTKKQPKQQSEKNITNSEQVL